MSADEIVRKLLHWWEQPDTRTNLLMTANRMKQALARDDLTGLQRAELERELLLVKLHHQLWEGGEISSAQARRLRAADVKVRRARNGEKES